MSDRSTKLEIVLTALLNAHTTVYSTEEEQQARIASATVAAIEILGLQKKFSSAAQQVARA